MVLAPWAWVLVVAHEQLKLWEQGLFWVLELSKEEMGQRQGQQARLVQPLGERISHSVLERGEIETMKLLLQISDSDSE